MKFCNQHWDKLKEVIDIKGMSHLIAKDGNTLLERLKKEAKEELTIIDPLMTSMMLINQQAIKQGGLYLLNVDEHGNGYCPLCEVDKGQIGSSDIWIEGATEDCLDYCKKNNLLNFN